MSRVLQTLNEVELRIAVRITFANEHLPDRVNSHATRNIARERAAHAVRDDQDESFIT
jgi:hypothetical protein